MTVEVRPIGLGKEVQPFIDLLWRIYADDPVWVPPLRTMLRDQLDPHKSPFLRQGEAQLFLAERDSVPVGRISAHLNPLHDRHHHERAGFFGFFECEDDLSTARALFEAAETWLADHDVAFARGPLSFSINDESGCLVDGFDTPPSVAMPHGRPYYDALLQECGYHKVKDLWAWACPVTDLEDRLRDWRDRIHALPNVRVREFNKKNRTAFRQDVRIATEIFNDAWQDNWGFVPVTREESEHLSDNLVRFADPGLTAIVEVNGDPAAMVMAIPDLNKVIHDINGRLLPFNWIKVWWRLRRGPRQGRVILLGVKRRYRTRALAGMALMLMAEVHVRGKHLGYEWAELGWVLEDNALLNSSLQRTQARVYKIYRLYEKPKAAFAAPVSPALIP